MKNIMLVCGAGMSTSLLVTKMEKAANALGDEVHIFALPISEGIKRLQEVDCCLLGPQVRYEKKNIETYPRYRFVFFCRLCFCKLQRLR